ncbi:prophage regulatory protein [Paraburkholderia atlantica]|uniref:helix-turn-helix transcriptional regulator n=1 Tax=Paraburkholderia atlantica TaxID=2654982 RepID=UPI003D1C8499
MEHLLTLAEVRQHVGGLGQSTLYRLIQLGQFPRPIALGVGARVAWRQSEVERWIAERIAAAQAKDESGKKRKAKPDARPA